MFNLDNQVYTLNSFFGLEFGSKEAKRIYIFWMSWRRNKQKTIPELKNRDEMLTFTRLYIRDWK